MIINILCQQIKYSVDLVLLMRVRDACKAIILTAVIGHTTSQQNSEPTVEYCYRSSEHEERCFKSILSTNYRSTMKWPEARDWCKNQSDGYTLVTVRNDATQKALESFLLNNELLTQNVWIGATRRLNSPWKWIDGTVESGEVSYCYTEMILLLFTFTRTVVDTMFSTMISHLQPLKSRPTSSQYCASPPSMCRFRNSWIFHVYFFHFLGNFSACQESRE